MVLRLFVPPAEGQHHIIPRRPDPLGANATLQYAVLSSAALAAGYAAVATKYTKHVTPLARTSRTALFIRSAGRLGVWAAVAGAAVSTYYNSQFISVVVADTVKEPAPPKLWESTERLTVEDCCLAGAAVGVVAFMPTLFATRLGGARGWWARMVGMGNIGAGVGIVAAHGYFHYTGERQKALQELQRQRLRRTLEFHHIFWDKLLMAKMDPLIQQYVRHNGIFHAQLLPQEVYETPEKFGISSNAITENTTDTLTAADDGTHTAYYIKQLDHAELLRTTPTEVWEDYVMECERTKADKLEEAEFVAYHLASKQYTFCHTIHVNEENKEFRLRELQLLGVVMNQLRMDAAEMDRQIFVGKSWIKQKIAWESSSPSFSPSPQVPSSTQEWTSTPSHCEGGSHDPWLSLEKVEALQDQFSGEIAKFEGWLKTDVVGREKWKKDLEDARIMLRAADQVAWELELAGKAKQGASKAKEMEDEASDREGLDKVKDKRLEKEEGTNEG